jgi:hypothetical protein
MRAVGKSYIVILKPESVGFAISIDSEVLHIPGVVAVGIIEPVFLTLWIEVSTRRFEVGAFALGDLVKVDGVLSGREIVKVEFDSDTRSFLPKGGSAYALPLGIHEFNFPFNFGLGGAA